MSDDGFIPVSSNDGFIPVADNAQSSPSVGSRLKTLWNNIPKDVGENLLGVAKTIKEGAYDMPKRALETGLEMASGTPYSETPSGKTDTQLVKNAPQQGKDMIRPIAHPVDYTVEHPVSQALNLLGVGATAVDAVRGTGTMLGNALKESPITAPIDPAIQEAATKMGIGNMDAAGLTQSITQGKLAKALSSLPFSADPMMAHYKDMLLKYVDKYNEMMGSGASEQDINTLGQQIRQRLGDLIQNQKSTLPASDVGSSIQNDFQNASKTAYEQSKADYAKANAMQPTGKVSGALATDETPSIQDVSSRLLKQQLNIPETNRAKDAIPMLYELSGKNDVQKALAKMQENTPPSQTTIPEGFLPPSGSGGASDLERQKLIGILQKQGLTAPIDIEAQKAQVTQDALANHGYNIPALKGILSDLDSRVRSLDAGRGTALGNAKFMSSPEAGIYKQLETAIHDAIDNHASQSGGDYGDLLQNANSNYSDFKKLFRENDFVRGVLNSQKPSDIVDRIIAPKDPEASSLAQSLLSSGTKDNVKELLSNRLLGGETGQPFSPNKLRGQLARYGDETLSKWYSPQEIKSLKNLSYGAEGFDDLKPNNPFFSKIISNASINNPDSIVNFLLKKNNVNNINSVFDAVGPEVGENLRAYLSKAISLDTKGEVSPTKIVSTYEKYGDKTITALLGEQRADKFRTAYLAGKGLGAAEAAARNPSQTAQLMGAMRVMIFPILEAGFGLATGHGLGGVVAGAAHTAAAMYGLPAMAKAYLGSTGTKFLTRAMEMPKPQTLGPAFYAGPMLGTMKAAQDQNGSQN